MIKAAALKIGTKVHTLEPPARHHNIIWQLSANGLTKKQLWHAEQGFVDDKGNFLDRKTAAVHAIECGQIEKLNWPPNLFSEDLW